MDKAKQNTPPKNKDSQSPIRISDLYLSSFLKARGVILKGVCGRGGKVVFIFQNDGKIQDLINNYYNDFPIGVLSYKAALRDLRSIIFNYKESALAEENQLG